MSHDISHNNDYDSVETGHLAKHHRVYFITKLKRREKVLRGSHIVPVFSATVKQEIQARRDAEQAH